MNLNVGPGLSGGVAALGSAGLVACWFVHVWRSRRRYVAQATAITGRDVDRTARAERALRRLCGTASDGLARTIVETARDGRTRSFLCEHAPELEVVVTAYEREHVAVSVTPLYRRERRRVAVRFEVRLIGVPRLRLPSELAG